MIQDIINNINPLLIKTGLVVPKSDRFNVCNREEMILKWHIEFNAKLIASKIENKILDFVKDLIIYNDSTLPLATYDININDDNTACLELCKITDYAIKPEFIYIQPSEFMPYTIVFSNVVDNFKKDVRNIEYNGHTIVLNGLFNALSNLTYDLDRTLTHMLVVRKIRSLKDKDINVFLWSISDFLYGHINKIQCGHFALYKYVNPVIGTFLEKLKNRIQELRANSDMPEWEKLIRKALEKQPQDSEEEYEDRVCTMLGDINIDNDIWLKKIYFLNTNRDVDKFEDDIEKIFREDPNRKTATLAKRELIDRFRKEVKIVKK